MNTLEQEPSFLSKAKTFSVRFMFWCCAIGIILMCTLIFLAMYGIYMLLNEMLYVTNLIIFGLNMIVSPFAMAIKSMIDGINSAIKSIQDIFDKLNPANWGK